MTAPSPRAPLLDIEDLWVSFPGAFGAAPVEAVRGVSVSVARGERVALVGESGSGKSLTARAIVGLMPPSACWRARRLTFQGQDLAALSKRDWRRLRGRRLAMVLQDPRYSLNPVMRVDRQVIEALRAADPTLSRLAARERARAALDAVHLRDVDRVMRAWPHQLSGGMGQRVMIAMMVALGPDLLIADEPTSALDVTTQTQVLAILDELVEARGMGLLFISHDLPLVAGFCDRVAVMHAGRVVETLPAADLAHARHPYTRGLLAALPDPEGSPDPLPVLRHDPAWWDGPSGGDLS
ncbi:ABC transporter ATP-binding protein [Pararhodospirillum oryzae]|uniref:ABC transporter ATP-binding protein n=1 Tax=Pararhodospirillum oryzae TaxID=478448 RepID=A0A512H5E5_9PROT|nr:ABC transporter ATP-binding protein [Pararhodospirillum oryzae]GEO80695.1 ABC transporter ATP-binding protein [Pararhodospirillum oryzae]